MDRQLTDHEKEQYRKKFGRPGKYKSFEPFRISYRAAIISSTLAIFLVMPLLVDYAISSANTSESSKPAADPKNEKNEAILQVYTARTWGPKGLFSVHSWIAMKPQGSEEFEVSQVIGWRQDGLGNVVFRETNIPVNTWWGNEATLILELQGKGVSSIIDRVDAAINKYPWKKEYGLYPGPNSNTFVAWVGLQVPEMGLDLPSTAIGKDWRPLEQALSSSASGTGLQASLFGLLGASIGVEEGLEINVLGLNFEIDFFDLALELPLFGRYEIWYLLCYLAIWFLVKKWIHQTKSKYFYL